MGRSGTEEVQGSEGALGSDRAGSQSQLCLSTCEIQGKSPWGSPHLEPGPALREKMFFHFVCIWHMRFREGNRLARGHSCFLTLQETKGFSHPWDKLAGEALEGLNSVPFQRHFLFPELNLGRRESIFCLSLALHVPPFSSVLDSLCNFLTLSISLPPSLCMSMYLCCRLSPCFFYLHLHLSFLLPLFLRHLTSVSALSLSLCLSLFLCLLKLINFWLCWVFIVAHGLLLLQSTSSR